MSTKEDPFRILREKLKKKKKKEEQEAEARKARATPSPDRSGPAPPRTPSRPAQARPADGAARGRTRQRLEHAPPKREENAPGTDADPLPPPKGLVRHRFALEDANKMKSSKARFAPRTPEKFKNHRHDRQKKQGDD